MVRLFCTLPLLLMTAGCSADLTFPVPPQQTLTPHAVNAVLKLTRNRGDVPWAAVTGDVLPPAPDVDWRWTRAHPTVEFELMDSDGWSVTMRLTAVAKVLTATGPQHVAIEVNRELIARSTLDHAGTYDLTFPVRSDLLRSSQRAEVRLDIDPCLTVDSGGERGLKLCVLLHSIGFIRAPR